MAEEPVSLAWNSFTMHLAATFQNMYNEKSFTDVTLVCDDQVQFDAHKIVLSSCSSVLRKILEDNPHPNPLIYMRGIKHQELESLLQFMYIGNVVIFQDRIENFMEVANELKLGEFIHDSSVKLPIETQIEEEHIITNEYAGAGYDEESKHEKINSEEVESTEEDRIKSQPEGAEDKKTDPKNYQCDECVAAYTCIKTLTVHKKSKHEGVRYSCTQCEHQYIARSDLKMHHKAKHEFEKLVCDKCEYRANWEIDLRRHKQSTHDGVRYPCNKCEYKATRLNNLKAHQKSKHEGVRYSCNQCEFQFFSDKSNLKRHLQTEHLGIKYHCDQCNFQAKKKSALHLHQQTQHS